MSKYKIVKCPCGDPHCAQYFCVPPMYVVQGAGISRHEAERIKRALEMLDAADFAEELRRDAAEQVGFEVGLFDEPPRYHEHGERYCPTCKTRFDGVGCPRCGWPSYSREEDHR